MKIPERRTGLSRIWAAFFYSLGGLKHAITREAAFIQEVIIFLVAMVALVFLPLSHFWKALLIFVTASVLIVELLNSAVETLVDMVSPDYHELAKRAKDLGSAAVLLSIAVAILVWGFAVFSIR